MAKQTRAAIIRSNAKEFILKLNGESMAMNMGILHGFAEYADKARGRAVTENMVKGTLGRGRKMFHPTKLTIRSGLLAKTLQQNYGWTFHQKGTRLNSTDLIFTVTPQAQGNRFYYLGKFYVTGKNPQIKWRLMNEYGIGKTRLGKPRKARPFMTPAINAQFKELPQTMKNHVKMLSQNITI